MRRSFVLCAALLTLLLGACAPPNTAVPATGQTETAQPVATPDIANIVKAQPDDWKRGPDDAKVTIIEWGDFQ